MSFLKDTYWHISTALNPDKYGKCNHARDREISRAHETRAGAQMSSTWNVSDRKMDDGQKLCSTWNTEFQILLCIY